MELSAKNACVRISHVPLGDTIIRTGSNDLYGYWRHQSDLHSRLPLTHQGSVEMYKHWKDAT